MQPGGWLAAMLLWCLCATLCAGCGSVAGVLIAPVIVGAVPVVVAAAAHVADQAESAANPQDPTVTEVLGGAPIDHPIDDVYRALIRVAGTYELELVADDPSAYKLRVSYPFSLVHNNWGGEITISCVVDGYGTRVLFENDGRDALPRIQKIEAKLLDGTLKWLRQPGLKAQMEQQRSR